MLLDHKPKLTFGEYIQEHASAFRRGLAILTLFFFLLAIRSYITYGTIQQAIVEEKQEVKNIKSNIDYLNNFKKKYLKSEYAPYLLGHENNRYYKNEKLIYLIYKTPESEQKTQENIINNNGKNTPIQQRKKLIEQKMGYMRK